MKHILLLWLLMAQIFVSSLWSQPGFSGLAGRFQFREMSDQADTAVRSVSLPIWFPLPGGAPEFYFGAVNRFGLGGLTECVFGGSLLTAGGGLRVDAFTSGDVHYRRAGGQFSMIRRLSAALWFGTGMGFSFTGISGYGSSWAPQVRLGFAGMIGPKSYWGFGWENPQQVLSAKAWYGNEAMRIRLGLTHVLSSRLDFYGSMEWESGVGVSGMLRAHHRISSLWKMGLGWAWRPDQILLSVHRKWRGGWMGVGFSQDPVLGSSFSFFSQWGARKNKR
jgi:hypothetical protein